MAKRKAGIRVKSPAARPFQKPWAAEMWLRFSAAHGPTALFRGNEASLGPADLHLPGVGHELVLLRPTSRGSIYRLQAPIPGLTMTEQNGMKILCDAVAAGSDLSSFFSLGTPVGTPAPAPASTSTQPAKRVKLSHDGPVESPAAASNANNVCYVCKRVYERADHLTRHMRSHENARPYACTRCPKRFNRAYVPPLPFQDLSVHSACI